jgi:hypothetical protein
MEALTREACCESRTAKHCALISQTRRSRRDRLPSGAEFQFSATTSPLLRFAKGSRIPLTWSLAPGGWDGLSRLHGNAEQSRGAERQSAR